MVGLLLALSLFNSGANVAETSAWPGPMHAWPGSVPWCVLAEHWRWFRARTYWPVGSAGESKCPFIHHASASFVSYFISSGREAQSHRATCMPLRPRSSAACVPSRGTCEPHLPFVARVASAPPPHKSEENNTLYRLSLNCYHRAGIAQLGERQTEDLKVACSIHAHRIPSFFSQSDSALI
jgi:hypothetical protein